MEADFASEYGIDLGDRAMISMRTWRWLRLRIIGLLSADTRLYRALTPAPAAVPEAPEHDAEAGGG